MFKLYYIIRSTIAKSYNKKCGIGKIHEQGKQYESCGLMLIRKKLYFKKWTLTLDKIFDSDLISRQTQCLMPFSAVLPITL